MRRIEEVGKPAFLIVPNGHHRLDADTWKKRYPKLKVLCPPGAKEKASEAVAVNSTDDILSDKDVDFIIVGGTGGAEAALVVRRAKGTTLIVNDVVANVRHRAGWGRKSWRACSASGSSARKSPASSSARWSRMRRSSPGNCASGRKFRSCGASSLRTAKSSIAPRRSFGGWRKSYCKSSARNGPSGPADAARDRVPQPTSSHSPILYPTWR